VTDEVIIMIKKFVLIFLILVLISSCQRSQINDEKASQVLALFFSELATGNYAEAATLYGGSYEVLADQNPDLNLDDHAALWNNGCTINGFQCLTIRTINFNELNDSGEYIFTVEFNDPDGNIFVLEPCCGESPTTPPQFQFEYRVIQDGYGKFKVLDLPVYVP
jgi:hypothetical protein